MDLLDPLAIDATTILTSAMASEPRMALAKEALPDVTEAARRTR
jgi:hypothetical protein